MFEMERKCIMSRAGRIMAMLKEKTIDKNQSSTNNVLTEQLLDDCQWEIAGDYQEHITKEDEHMIGDFPVLTDISEASVNWDLSSSSQIDIESHSQLFPLIHNSRQIEILYSEPEYQENATNSRESTIAFYTPPVTLQPLTNVVFSNDDNYGNDDEEFDKIDDPDYDVNGDELNISNASETTDLNVIISQQAEVELEGSIGKEVPVQEKQDYDVNDDELNISNASETTDLNVIISQQAKVEIQGNIGKEVPMQEKQDADKENSGKLGRMVKKRKRIAGPDDWFDNKNKKLREQGKSYIGWKTEGNKRKRGGDSKEERKMGPPCNSIFCKKSQVIECGKLSQEEREKIFKSFWSEMNWDQKKIYIVSLVKKNTTKRCTISTTQKSRRSATLTYTIKTSIEQQALTVCKKMFLSTFGLKEWTVLNWVNNTEHHGICTSRKITSERIREKSLNNLTQNLDQGSAKTFLCRFLDEIPKLPSHYCRKSTTKQYIEPIFGDKISGLYREYVKQCRDTNIAKLSRFTFEKIIHEKNIGFQQPKKDRCDTCIGYETNNIDESTYKQHQKLKEAARLEKATDQQLAEQGECVVLTQDVQAVKVCPSLNASALYFKTKLCVHNFSIYEVNTHHARCYWFTEVDADLTANTFASCIIDYLCEKFDSARKSIIIWSDGCGYQNKNSTLSNALLSFAVSKNVTVYQKYLEVGHTQMEVDSVHSCIENKIKNKAIHLPSDYGRYTREARMRGVGPYEVKEISYSFVKDYSLASMVKYPSIRPGKKTNDPTVSEIKVIKYTPDGIIQVKLSFDGQFVDLPGRKIGSVVVNLCDFPQLRDAPIKIKYTKWQHLQQLKDVIPSDCGSYYDNLPHEEKPIKETKKASIPQKGKRKKNNQQIPSKGKKRSQHLQESLHPKNLKKLS